MELRELATVGDTIEADVRHPRAAVLRVQLLTPEACAEGNKLLMDSESGWRLVNQKRL